jgi:hypothetical protein
MVSHSAWPLTKRAVAALCEDRDGALSRLSSTTARVKCDGWPRVGPLGMRPLFETPSVWAKMSTEDEECSRRQSPHSGHELPRAYEQRTAQLYDARAALAEAVSTLRTELGRRNMERDHAIAESRALRERVDLLESELRGARADIAALQGMKVVRWTAWPRRVVYRIRARRG